MTGAGRAGDPRAQRAVDFMTTTAPCGPSKLWLLKDPESSETKGAVHEDYRL